MSIISDFLTMLTSAVSNPFTRSKTAINNPILSKTAFTPAQDGK
jgi:hypothetical protein